MSQPLPPPSGQVAPDPAVPPGSFNQPATVARADRHTARAACWACGTVLEKNLRGGRRQAARLNWHCRGCDVSWSGPADRPRG